jgi:hypothetical protein
MVSALTIALDDQRDAGAPRFLGFLFGEAEDD